MWTTTVQQSELSTSMLEASVDVLIDPRHGDASKLGVIHITVPPGAKLPPHNHGDSEGVMIAVSGALTLFDGEGNEHALKPGALTVVVADEKVSAENKGSEPAKLIVCFAPPTFVERLGAAKEG